MTTLLDKSYTKYRLHLMLLTACIIHIKLIMQTYWLSTENSRVQNRILNRNKCKSICSKFGINRHRPL